MLVVAMLVCMVGLSQAFVAAPATSLLQSRNQMMQQQSNSRLTMHLSPVDAVNVLQSSASVLLAAAAEPGTVDAPSWVLPAGAGVVILTALAIPLLLKPGDDAARDMQDRDKNKFGKK